MIAYIARRKAEGLSDRDIVRRLKRHIANEIFELLTRPANPLPIGPELRQRRQSLGISIVAVASLLEVPDQRIRRLEIGQRTDPELETAFTMLLAAHHATPISAHAAA